MTYVGQMQNGVIVFPVPVPIPEGAAVEVAVRAAEKSPTTHFDIFKDVIGRAVGLPEDMALNHSHYLRGGPKQ